MLAMSGDAGVGLSGGYVCAYFYLHSKPTLSGYGQSALLNSYGASDARMSMK